MASWTNDEIAALSEHYISKGPNWDGWKDLLPNRTIGAIYHKAHCMGMVYDKAAGGARYVRMPCETCGDCTYFRACRCYEKHAIGLFKGAPKVEPHYDASLCGHRLGKLVRL